MSLYSHEKNPILYTLAQDPAYTLLPSPICLGTRVLLYKCTVMRDKERTSFLPFQQKLLQTSADLKVEQQSKFKTIC